MTTQNTINNADVLRTVTVSPMIDGFKTFIKGWPTKFAGPVPSPEMLTVALLFGKNRKPGPEAGFVAMQLRVEGASVAELSAAFNSGPAHNHSRDLSSDNKGQGLHYFTRTKGNGRFWLTFTAKGVKALEKALQGLAVAASAPEKAADKPKAKKAGKAAADKKATSKPRKAKVKAPAETVPEPTAEPDLPAQHETSIVERVNEGPIDQPAA